MGTLASTRPTAPARRRAWPAAALHSELCPCKISVEKEKRTMSSKPGFFCAVVLAALVFTSSASAQVELGANARPRITQWIDETNRVALAGNTHPEARPANDRGGVPSDFAMEHMLLQLQRSAEQEAAVQQFLEELTTQGSPNFHQWLTAQEFGERFGLAKPDIDGVTGWLKAQGFRVNVVYPSGMLI